MKSGGPVIAIDGYSSCGKSTVARAIAAALHIRYVDSGAMYRAVTLYFLNHHVPFTEGGPSEGVDYTKVLDQVHIGFDRARDGEPARIYLNGEDVTVAIRQMEVSSQVSHVSAIREVRKRLVHLQQKMGAEGGLVMDGRDIGTTVFPDADLKFFMTADPKIRAQRRYDELRDAGVAVTYDEVFENINSRDYEDSHRKESPLRQAADAVVLDNTTLDHAGQVRFVMHEIRSRGWKVPA